MIYQANELDLLEAVSLPKCQPILSIYIELSSFLDVSKLYQALLHMVSIVPQLGCRFDQKRNEWHSLSLSPSSLIKEVDEIDFSCWNVQRDPQILIQIERHRGRVAVGFSHILTDANGAMQLLYLLCEAYSGQFSTVNNQRALSGLAWNKAQGNAGRKHKEYPLIWKERSDTGNRTVCCHVFDLALIKQIARQNKVTVNDILLCAFFQTLYHITKQSNISLSSPVNLRQFLKDCPPLTVTNFIGDYSVTLKNIEHKTWKQLLDEIHTQMLQEKNENRQLKMVMPLHYAYHILPKSLSTWIAKKAYHTPGVSLTNPGILDASRLTFGDVKVLHAYVVSRVQRYPSMQITASSFQTQCTLTCHVDGSDEEMNAVHKILSYMEKCLYEYEAAGKK